MDDLTYSIQKQKHKDEKLTESWLKQNGIKSAQLTEIKIHLLQAQKTATNLLKHHKTTLEQHQIGTLQDYLHAMSNKRLRIKLTQAQAHQVMNIGTKTNRKLFKKHRQHI